MYKALGVEMVFCICKHILDVEKNGNKKEMQADVIFYSSLLSLPFRYSK